MGDSQERVFPHGQYAVLPIERGAPEMPTQTVDFSPVITIFHVFSPIFHPISQLQGFDFSSVRKNTQV
jgi:hypothetical protein